MRRLKRQHSQQELAMLSLDVLRQLQPLIAGAKTIMLYYSLPDEVDTHELTGQLVAQGKTVLLPRVTADGTIEVCQYAGADDLRPGPFGIMEPVGPLFTRLSDIDAVVVPGMAFDSTGRRLGRGRGYYDRFFSAAPPLYKIGLCFPFQLVDCVPAEPHDVVMDAVIAQP